MEDWLSAQPQSFNENTLMDITFSVSAGCAAYEQGLKLDEWINRADRALTSAKISGRSAASEWIPSSVRDKYTKYLMMKLRSNSMRHDEQ
jgi:GGDEF domain-containing protein